MAVVGTANRGLIVYQLENQPSEYKVVKGVFYILIKFNFFFCRKSILPSNTR